MARARRRPQRHPRSSPNSPRRTRSPSKRTRCASRAGCLLSRPTRGRHRRRRIARTACPPACATSSGRCSAQRRPASGTQIFPVSRHYEMLALDHRSYEARALGGRQEFSPWIPQQVPLRPTTPTWCCVRRLLCYVTRCGELFLVSIMCPRVLCTHIVFGSERKDAPSVRCAAYINTSFPFPQNSGSYCR